MKTPAALATTDTPLVLECRATRIRHGTASIVARYEFTFTQLRDGVTRLVYEGDQTAWWTNVNRPGSEDTLEAE